LVLGRLTLEFWNAVNVGLAKEGVETKRLKDTRDEIDRNMQHRGRRENGSGAE
jgi:hypothetical protein